MVSTTVGLLVMCALAIGILLVTYRRVGPPDRTPDSSETPESTDKASTTSATDQDRSDTQAIDPDAPGLSGQTHTSESEPRARTIRGRIRDALATVGVIRLAFINLGVISLTAALVILFAPQVVPDRSGLELLVTALHTQTLQVLGAFALLSGVVFYASRRLLSLGPSDALPRVSEPVPYPPESVQTAVSARAGAPFDDRLAQFTGSDTDDRHEEQLETALRETAVAVLATYGGFDDATAQEQLDTGAWTTDPRAAAYLGGAAAPSPPWYIEIWDRLHPLPRATRRIQHTIAALETYADEHEHHTASSAASSEQTDDVDAAEAEPG